MSKPLIFTTPADQLNAHPDVPGTKWAMNKTGRLLILPLVLVPDTEVALLWVSVTPRPATAYIRSGYGSTDKSQVTLCKCEFGEDAKALGDFIRGFPKMLEANLQ